MAVRGVVAREMKAALGTTEVWRKAGQLTGFEVGIRATLEGIVPQDAPATHRRQLLTEAAASRAPNRGRNPSRVRARVPSATQE